MTSLAAAGALVFRELMCSEPVRTSNTKSSFKSGIAMIRLNLFSIEVFAVPSLLSPQSTGL